MVIKMKRNEVEEICYNCCNEANWQNDKLLKIYNGMCYKYHELPKLYINDIIIRALAYARREKDIRKFFLLISIKCGKQKADDLFNRMFLRFSSIDDLCDSCYALYGMPFVHKRIMEFASLNGLSEQEVERFARLSKKYDGYLTIDKEPSNINKSPLKDRYPNYYKIIPKLENIKDIDDVIIFLDGNDKFDMEIIKQMISLYYQDLYKNRIHEKVISRIRAYNNYVDKKNEYNSLNNLTKEDIDKANNVITSYVNGNYNSLLLFLSDNNINRQVFDFIVKAVKNNNFSLYKQFIEKYNREDEKITINSLREIVSGIMNGVDGRDFTLTDYCKISYFSLDSFYSSILAYNKKGVFTNEECYYVNKFYRRYRFNSILRYSEIMNNKVEINCERDQDGFPIPGTGYVITDEDKQKVLDEIDSYRCPYYYESVFKSLLKKHLMEKGKIKNKIRK